MSDTPRTDAAILNASIPTLHDGDVIVVYAEVARSLEKEISAKHEEIERLRAANKDLQAWFEDLKVEFDKVRSELDDAYAACGIRHIKSGEPK